MAEATADITVRIVRGTQAEADAALVKFAQSILRQNRQLLEERTGQTITDTDISNATPARLKKGITILVQDYLEEQSFLWDSAQKDYDRFDIGEVDGDFFV